MSNNGRRKDLIWLNFEELKNHKKRELCKKLKKFKKEMRGYITRMKKLKSYLPPFFKSIF